MFRDNIEFTLGFSVGVVELQNDLIKLLTSIAYPSNIHVPMIMTTQIQQATRQRDILMGLLQEKYKGADKIDRDPDEIA